MALLSLSRIQSKRAIIAEPQAIARANARMAMMLALAELQQYAGPDQRITAQAAILEDPDSDTLIANRYWTGVWRTDGLKGEPLVGAEPLINRSKASSGHERGSLVDRRADGSYDPSEQALRWLVSGLDGNTLHPGQEITGDAVTLVGRGSVESNDDHVVASKVSLLNQNSNLKGKMAWWVGDQGVKASLNLSSAQNYTVVPAQNGVDKIPGYESYRDASNEIIERTITQNSTGISSGLNILPAERRKQFHNLTCNSVGVIADTLRSGLRRDLTAFLNDGSAPDLGDRKGLQADTPIIGGEEHELLSAKFGLLKQWSEIASNSGNSGVEVIAPRSAGNAAAWGWSPTQMDYGTGLDLTRQDTPPIHPVMIDAGVSYGASLRRVSSSEGVSQYQINVHYFPRIVLWNPYNVKLNAEEYAVQISMPHRFRVRVLVPGLPEQAPIFFEPIHQQYVGENLPHRPCFSIPKTEFEPGEALLFTADAGGGDSNRFWGAPNSATAKDLKNFSLSCRKSAPFRDNFFIRTTQTISIPDDSLQNAAYQIFAEYDGFVGSTSYKLYWYKLFLNRTGSSDVSNISKDPYNFDPLQFISVTENGAAGSYAPRFDGIPPSASSPLRPEGQPLDAYYRFKWGHRIQWFDETVENQSITPGPYNAPYQSYNTMANHNIRAGWHMRSPIEVAYRATDSAGRYTAGIAIDDPYGWDWTDPSLFPVPVNGKNRVSPFGRAAQFGETTYPLLDIPTNDSPLVSIAALQHAPISQFPWHPLNAIGNGLADPRVPRNQSSHHVNAAQWQTIGWDGNQEWSRLRQAHVNGAMDQANFLHDLSYEANHALWDTYFFSSISDNVATEGEQLPNPRLTKIKEADSMAFPDYHRSAGHFMINGAFNVNSTSVDAWVALLSSVQANSKQKIPAQNNQQIAGDNVFSRLLVPYADKYTGGAVEDQAAWRGYREIADEDIRILAEEIVREVKQRGPFISLADFINRRLVDTPRSSGSETDHSRTGLKGTLQAAIDRTSINGKLNNSYPIAKEEYRMGGRSQQVRYGSRYPNLRFPVRNGFRGFGPKPDHHHWADSKLVNAPSYLTQADLLQKIGPVLSARSDTFIIRAYGESLTPSGEIAAKSWCEAVVQRVPTPVRSDDNGLDPKPDSAVNSGRRFIITSFRWLNEDEI